MHCCNKTEPSEKGGRRKEIKEVIYQNCYYLKETRTSARKFNRAMSTSMSQRRLGDFAWPKPSWISLKSFSIAFWKIRRPWIGLCPKSWTERDFLLHCQKRWEHPLDGYEFFILSTHWNPLMIFVGATQEDWVFSRSQELMTFQEIYFVSSDVRKTYISISQQKEIIYLPVAMSVHLEQRL